MAFMQNGGIAQEGMNHLYLGQELRNIIYVSTILELERSVSPPSDQLSHQNLSSIIFQRQAWRIQALNGCTL